MNLESTHQITCRQMIPEYRVQLLTRWSTWSLSFSLSESNTRRLRICKNITKLASQTNKLSESVPYLIRDGVAVRGNRSFLPRHRSRLWHSTLEVRMQIHRKCTLFVRWRPGYMCCWSSCSSPRNWARHLAHIKKIKSHRNNVRRCLARTHQCEGRNSLLRSDTAIRILHAFVGCFRKI